MYSKLNLEEDAHDANSFFFPLNLKSQKKVFFGILYISCKKATKTFFFGLFVLLWRGLFDKKVFLDNLPTSLVKLTF
jgi:hypothetical protein